VTGTPRVSRRKRKLPATHTIELLQLLKNENQTTWFDREQMKLERMAVTESVFAIHYN
jgi:hypothetical protein